MTIQADRLNPTPSSTDGRCMPAGPPPIAARILNDRAARASMREAARPSPLETVVNARRRFERVLAGWACDLLALSRERARQDDESALGHACRSIDHPDSWW